MIYDFSGYDRGELEEMVVSADHVVTDIAEIIANGALSDKEARRAVITLLQKLNILSSVAEKSSAIEVPKLSLVKS